jgi:hypothetical protein
MRSEAPAIDADPSTTTAVVGGPRWYRTRILLGGPLVGLSAPLALGLVALMTLRLGSGRMSAVLGLLAGVIAAPGLLVVGAPIADESSYPVAIALSVAFWVVIGVIAARRAIRRPIASWRDFWLQFTFLGLATAIGAIVGMAIAAARIGETLL